MKAAVKIAPLLFAVCVACDPSRQSAPLPAPADFSASSSSIAVGPLADERTQGFYAGYFAEIVRGDLNGARAAYRSTLDNAPRDPQLAGKAALHLAEIEALAGRPRDALELLSRAAALAPDDRDIAERAADLRVRLMATVEEQSEVRGPPRGTPVAGASTDVAKAFASAEIALDKYHQRPRLRIEDFRRAGLRLRNKILSQAVEAYQRVIEFGDPAATAAAEFRIGSLFHDSSVSLLFELPSDLNPRAMARERRALQPVVLDQLRRARDAYRRAVDAASDDSTAAKPWRAAAQLALGSVEDLLRGSD